MQTRFLFKEQKKKAKWEPDKRLILWLLNTIQNTAEAL